MLLRMVMALLAGLSIISACRAQSSEESSAPPEVSRFGQRYDAFLLIFADLGFEKGSLSELAQRRDRGVGWTLVMLGETPLIGDLPIDLSDFVRSGGSLFVATDGPTNFPLAGGPHFRVVAGPVEAVKNSDAYQDLAACPLITNFRRESSLFLGVNQLALNLPGFIAGGDSANWTMARFPKSVNIGMFAPAVMAGGDFGSGRFLVSADQSLLTNEMIEEADNARFADNVAIWLRHDIKARPDDAPPRVVVLIDRKEVPSLIDERFISGKWADTPPTNELINELLHGLQEEDALNEIFREGEASLSSNGPWPVRQFLIIAIASMVAALLVWRILSARKTETPQAIVPVAEEDWAASLSPTEMASLVRAHRLIEMREREFRQIGNFSLPLELLARSFFSDHCVGDEWMRRMPTFAIRGTLLERWAARRDVARLWKHATGVDRRHVSQQKFDFWKARISRLDSMVESSAMRGGASDSSLLAGNS